MADYPQDFQKAVDDLIDHWEGTVFTQTPGDAGGGTKFGISTEAYPKLNIRSLTRDQAIAIYYRDYWPPSAKILDAALRAKIFNMGVLMGAREAVLLAFGCHTLDEFKQVCVRHYEAIVIKHPEDAKFLKGWKRRALA